MGTKYLSTFIETQKSLDQLRDDAANIFLAVGGPIYKTATGFSIANGKTGVTVGFAADLSANVIFQTVKENKYEVQIFLNWKWGSYMWMVIILGILTGGISLVLLLVYLFFDPLPVYQQVLSRLIGYENL